MKKNGIFLSAVAALTATTVFADDELNLSDILDLKVVTASKTEQKISDAPAIVSVVTQDEIRNRSYRSVGEALESVPGLYGIYDNVSYNIGVRGVSGGMRAYSRIMKVMINGQQISFRSDSANYLGPEFLPMEAVDRIEVVRGPASALYGANAFLAVVNVILKTPSSDHIASVTARGEVLKPNMGIGGDALVQGAGESLSGLLSGSYHYLDRSGYVMPSTPPLTGPGGQPQATAGNVTVQDYSKPSNAVTNVRWKINPNMTLDLLGHWSLMNTSAQFIDFGTMVPQNIISLSTTTGRFKLDWQVTDKITLTNSLALSSGGVTDKSRYYPAGITGNSDSRIKEELNYFAFDWVTEGRLSLAERDSVTLGLDFTSDNEQLRNIYSISVDSSLNDVGAPVVQGKAQGKKTFSNFGAYAQYMTYPMQTMKSLGLTANLRFDSHNLYGTTLNYRAGLVDQFMEGWNGKLLIGSSYKAPTPVQMYGQPLYTGEVQGNPDLKPETAMTLEAEISSKIGNNFVWSVNGYYMNVKNRVELLLNGGTNYIPTNVGSSSGFGLESGAKWFMGGHIVSASFQTQNTTNTINDPFNGDLKAPSSAYPRVMTYLGWQYRDSTWGVTSLDNWFVGDRRASRVNVAANLTTPYVLSNYFTSDLSYSYPWKNMKFGLKMRNILDTSYTEPGYGGIDIPGRRRNLLLTVNSTF